MGNIYWFGIRLSLKEKPPRWVVIVLAFIILVMMLFFCLWLIDPRTVFANDYPNPSSWGRDFKMGWLHLGMTILSVLGGIAWVITILTEFMAMEEKNRAFRNLYKHE